jgi:glycosyltransferase involved in cell wall biosynthesis
MRSSIKLLLQENTYDIIHADQLSMTQFVPTNNDGNQQPYIIFDAHNATWVIIERMREGFAWWLRPLLTVELGRTKEYEGGIVREFDCTLAVTEIDRAALRAAVDSLHEAGIPVLEKISVIPIAVDTEDLIPVEQIPTSREILTLGTLHYKPNADGIRWFLRDVFPLVQGEIPEVRLTIVGKNPPEDFLAIADEMPGSVEVTGYVEDLTPHFERSALIVVPVLAGSGMRVRILEAFARGMPVVTTSIGLEGIEADPGSDVLVADTPRAFASSVIKIMQDPHLHKELSKNGRRLAKRRYDWRIALREMDNVYSTAKSHLAEPPDIRG